MGEDERSEWASDADAHCDANEYADSYSRYAHADAAAFACFESYSSSVLPLRATARGMRLQERDQT